VGLVGGASAGAIVASLINTDVGKIVKQPVAKEQAFVDALRALAREAQPVRIVAPLEE